MRAYLIEPAHQPLGVNIDIRCPGPLNENQTITVSLIMNWAHTEMDHMNIMELSQQAWQHKPIGTLLVVSDRFDLVWFRYPTLNWMTPFWQTHFFYSLVPGLWLSWCCFHVKHQLCFWLSHCLLLPVNVVVFSQSSIALHLPAVPGHHNSQPMVCCGLHNTHQMWWCTFIGACQFCAWHATLDS